LHLILGIVPYQLPSSFELATIKQLEEYDVVMWEKLGFEPEGMTQQQMNELKIAFKLPK